MLPGTTYLIIATLKQQYTNYWLYYFEGELYVEVFLLVVSLLSR